MPVNLASKCVWRKIEEETIIAYSPEQGDLSVDTSVRATGLTKTIETAPFSLDANERLRLRILSTSR